MKYDKAKIFAFVLPLLIFLPVISYSAGYDFYVDGSSTKSTEDGTEAYPWKTVSAAMDHIRNNNLKKKTVYLKKGTYPESVEIRNGTSLFGEDRHETIVDGTGKHNGVYFNSTTSVLSGFTIANARTNIEIGKYSKATIDNCSVKDSVVDGIIVQKSTTRKKYSLIIRNSSVKDSGKRGIYVFRRKIELSNSEISGNGEEGIDLHTGVRGKISGNTISTNKESGIEMMIAGASMTIRGNRINSNRTQGLSIQFYDSRKGKVKVTKNTIRENHGYGIRYARYDRGKIKMKFAAFVKKYVKRSGNSVSGNGDGDYRYL